MDGRRAGIPSRQGMIGEILDRIRSDDRVGYLLLASGRHKFWLRVRLSAR